MSGAWRVPGMPACCEGSCGDDCDGNEAPNAPVQGSYDGGCGGSSIPGVNPGHSLQSRVEGGAKSMTGAGTSNGLRVEGGAVGLPRFGAVEEDGLSRMNKTVMEARIGTIPLAHSRAYLGDYGRRLVAESMPVLATEFVTPGLSNSALDPPPSIAINRSSLLMSTDTFSPIRIGDTRRLSGRDKSYAQDAALAIRERTDCAYWAKIILLRGFGVDLQGPAMAEEPKRFREFLLQEKNPTLAAQWRTIREFQTRILKITDTIYESAARLVQTLGRSQIG